jgi:hypothetical protein
MITYPVRVARSSYSGRDSKKREAASEFNRDAVLLENHINDQIKSGK